MTLFSFNGDRAISSDAKATITQKAGSDRNKNSIYSVVGLVNKAIAKRQEEKLRLDYELVRALKCAELQQKGFTFRPGSRVEHMCHDVVPIALLNKTTTE